ncbi:cyclic-phosphate processing receiver domain-containing protein [Singulisphaera rosea]
MSSMPRSSELPPSGPMGAKDKDHRILFLDDDPERAREFLAGNPKAVWVETVEDCLSRLEETWDEVHLDHDLGGERYVDFEREDCGMAIVRWLSLIPRPHLRATRFFVHSHNPSAARMMVMQMSAAGFRVEGRSFGSSKPWYVSRGDIDMRRPQEGLLVSLVKAIGRLFSGGSRQREA